MGPDHVKISNEKVAELLHTAQQQTELHGQPIDYEFLKAEVKRLTGEPNVSIRLENSMLVARTVRPENP